MERETLISFCQDVRRTLEEIRPNVKVPHFSQFPKGCCGDTCKILKYLLNRYLKLQTSINSGVCYKKTSTEDATFTPDHDISHAWLRYNNGVIDITADQFNGYGSKNDAVTVAPEFKFLENFETQTSGNITVLDIHNRSRWPKHICDVVSRLENSANFRKWIGDVNS